MRDPNWYDSMERVVVAIQAGDVPAKNDLVVMDEATIRLAIAIAQNRGTFADQTEASQARAEVLTNRVSKVQPVSSPPVQVGESL